MKKIVLLFAGLLIYGNLLAQRGGQGGQGAGQPIQRPATQRTPATPAPLPTRQVSGIVKDSTDQAVIGATVALISAHDTLKVSTNADGVFVYKAVKSPEFTLTVTSVGYATLVKKFFYAYTAARLVLDPLIVRESSIGLDAIQLNGTPAITYKTDTVEYRASDYKVRENATMEDLLKKMEGIEVDKDGNVTAQGIQVTRARLNGKNVAGADVAGLMRELPAEIAEKIQVIDDYGDQAELTGIKDGEPQKVLNIVTLRNKSVRNTGNFAANRANSGRYTANLGGSRANGNQNIRLSSNFNSTPTGLAGGSAGSGNGPGSGGRALTGGGGGGIGTSKRGSANISYSDDLNKNISLTGSYGYNGNGSNSVTKSNSERYSTTKGSDKIDTVYSQSERASDNDGHGHQLEARMDYKINTTTRMILNGSFNSNSSGSSGTSTNNQTGSRYQDQNTISNASGSAPTFNITNNISTRFGTKTNVSLQLTAGNNGNLRDQNSYNRLLYYNPATLEHELLKDSLVNRLINTDNETRNYRVSTTFSQGFGSASRIEFNGQVSYRGYDNSQVTNEVINDLPPVRVDRLSKIFNYSFTETRLALNYRRGTNTSKVNFSLGLTAVPAILKGTSETLHNTTERRSFNLIPITRVQYKWSNQKSLTVNYTGNFQEPSFDQIQDVPDESNPTNVIIGNPDLKPSFNHSITGSYNNYVAASRITMQFSLTSRFVENQIITNRIQLNDVYGSVKNETRYINQSGNHTYSGRYSLGKRFPNNTYGIKLDGNVNNNYSISRFNGEKNFRTNWQFQERLTLQITPNDWLEVNPFVSHDFSKNNYSLPTSRDSRAKNWALNLDGRMIIRQRFVFGYEMSKNYLSGLNVSTNANPLVVSTYLTKEFFKRKNATIRFSVDDLLNQNNYVNKQVSETGISTTQTNPNSRYFTLGVTWRPSKFSGGSGRTAGPRRGDGSFIIP